MAKMMSLKETMDLLNKNGITSQEQREYVINYIRPKVADHEVGIVIYYIKEGKTKEYIESEILPIVEKIEGNEEPSLDGEVR